ncbi:aerobactin siderophore biosynthesis protein iucB [Metarhizium album ARSEF 1941]|uniref:Aerobactin siderophore biosynthesis protein iucB n=1 Tax=Metarhizium album (strain ARSEF 1941) TaxID=1081103 RepID=A0A0B2WIQ4_METAS|nr:aerobactin siderophore biosynthesis protein iucB [Metarhizium album ARSEF 1941]KHN93728.1 aerobactin siderophore biosynthesis protein iucB [Metarhizium album ARSEF 1941]
MTPQILYLPDGKKFAVTPVFGGMGFSIHDPSSLLHLYPVGWMTALHTEEDKLEHDVFRNDNNLANNEQQKQSAWERDKDENVPPRAKRRTKPFTRPTLQNDTLFISSISMPSSADVKPAASPTREIAMMLWITLYWYFHQPPPDKELHTSASEDTPPGAKPVGEWKIRIRRDGVFRGRNLIPKLERMGLIASEDTAVGTCMDDSGDGWTNMFVSKRMFWQMPPNLFLFTPQPARGAELPGSPAAMSRPGSPLMSAGDTGRSDLRQMYSQAQSLSLTSGGGQFVADVPGSPMPTSFAATPALPIGPYFSSSHLPTYFPPPPLQYVYTNGMRHPLRPKPPRMGEVFYTRFVESAGQYLSFRVASVSTSPVPYLGPVGPNPPEQTHLSFMSDRDLLQSWFAVQRVKDFWGNYTSDFLETALCAKHSFPVIGLWDGVPFGYFELYWVKEDILGRHVAGEAGDWDRGLHIMIGEEWSRGRVRNWLTSLVHYCFMGDPRTMNVCLEPRIDNKRMLRHLDAAGFSKEKQVAFPHKQAWFVKLRREFWDGPAS